MEDNFDISTDNVEFFFAQTKPERAHASAARHTDHLDMVVYKR